MTELTTGIVFLMTSLYGASHGNTMNAANVAAAYGAGDQATTTQKVAMTDNAEIEAYVREQYADTPILIDIARCESRFHQYDKDGIVVRGEANRKDVGIMQINETYHAATAAKMGINIYSVEGNIAYGKYLYSKYGTSPWNYSSKCWNGGLIGEEVAILIA